MAQYYQIVPNQMTLEDLQRFYPNLCVDGGTIQYVINPEDQQFGQQQVILAGEQAHGIMVGAPLDAEPEGYAPAAPRAQYIVQQREPPPPPAPQQTYVLQPREPPPQPAPPQSQYLLAREPLPPPTQPYVVQREPPPPPPPAPQTHYVVQREQPPPPQAPPPQPPPPPPQQPPQQVYYTGDLPVEGQVVLQQPQQLIDPSHMSHQPHQIQQHHPQVSGGQQTIHHSPHSLVHMPQPTIIQHPSNLQYVDQRNINPQIVQQQQHHQHQLQQQQQHQLQHQHQQQQLQQQRQQLQQQQLQQQQLQQQQQQQQLQLQQQQQQMQQQQQQQHQHMQRQPPLQQQQQPHNIQQSPGMQGQPRLLNHHLGMLNSPRLASPQAAVRPPRPPRARPNSRTPSTPRAPRPALPPSGTPTAAPSPRLLRPPPPLVAHPSPPPVPVQQQHAKVITQQRFIVQQPPNVTKKIINQNNSDDNGDFEESIQAVVLQKNPTTEVPTEMRQNFQRQQVPQQQPSNMPLQQQQQVRQSLPQNHNMVQQQIVNQQQQHGFQQQQFNNNQQYQSQLQHQAPGHPSQHAYSGEMFIDQQGHQQQTPLYENQQQQGNLYDNPNQEINDEEMRYVAQANGQKVTMAEFRSLQLMKNNGQPPPSPIRGAMRGGRGGGAATASRHSTLVPRKQDLPVQVVSPFRPHQVEQQEPLNTLESGSGAVAAEPQSARMLILLQNGEQRLITFTLPKESCTVQELLEQVNVPFTADTQIKCISNTGCDIDYFVSVGSPNKVDEMMESMPAVCAESPLGGSSSAEASPEKALPSPAPPPPQPPPTPPSPPPRYVEGMLALCKFCGYTGFDFTKCQRCRRRFPEEPKAIPIATNKKPEKKEPIKSPLQMPLKEPLSIPVEPVKLNLLKPSLKVVKALNDKKVKGRKGRLKQLDPDPVILTLSSDEEDSNSSAQNFQGPSDLMPMMTNPMITMAATMKEPTLQDLETTPGSALNNTHQDTGLFQDEDREDIKEDTMNQSETLCTALDCRTVRIGSHRFTPVEKILISMKGVRIVAPRVDDPTVLVPLQLQMREVVKVLIHSGKGMPVLFLYTMQCCGSYVRKALNMTDINGPYYNSVAKEEQFKRITLLPNVISEETKNALKQIFGACIEDLTSQEANDILIRTCPKEVQQTAKMMTTRSNSIQIATAIGTKSLNPTEIRQILIYPPGKGGISINTEDYMCLAQDQFLNDVIIDFYLKYLCHDVFTPQQREKTHVFSTFFYKRLTTKPTKANRRSNPHEWDSSLTPAQKRHARVKSWTKNVNIFQRDYVIVPINENCHWFLAIICFPGLDGCRSMIGDRLVSPQEMKKRDRKTIQIGNTLLAPILKQEQIGLNCDGDNLSERDEAEAEESDLDMLGSESDNEDNDPKSSTSDRKPVENNEKPKDEAIKQPCILIFDSLAGASRSRVVATLRDYLTCEYHAKVSTEKTFTKDNIKGSCPKIPQQNNFTDCGLYLLQYVEHFFRQPVVDYHLPIKQLVNWFEEIVVTRKREEISNLLKRLMQQRNAEIDFLPEIPFPTLNGKLTEISEAENGESSEPQSSESGESAPLSALQSSKGKDTSMRSASVSSDTPGSTSSTTLRTLRLSTDPGEPRLNIKHSDLVNDIQNSLINNKINNDKGQKCLNVTVKQSGDSSTDTPKSDINPLKTRRIVKSDGAIESKRFKLSEFN